MHALPRSGERRRELREERAHRPLQEQEAPCGRHEISTRHRDDLEGKTGAEDTECARLVRVR
jgi:hypothetical protein